MDSILEIKKLCLAGMSQDEIKAYLKDFGLEWKDWYFNLVYSPGQLIENLHFWKPSSENVEYIRPCDVIGHNHGSLSDNTNWITLLSCLKRNRSDTNVNSVLQMLQEQDNLPTGSLIHLQKYGDKYFFCEGRHRMVQAKFLEIEKVRCKVTEFKYDETAYDLFCRIRKNAAIIKDRNWRLGQPIKAKIGTVSFDIPLEETAVTIFEEAIKEAKSILHKPVYRYLYFALHKQESNALLYYNLKHITSSELLVPAILQALYKSQRTC